MPKISEHSNNSVWGEDWTKTFRPNQLAPGTVVLDPHNEGVFHFGLENVPLLVNRPTLEVTTADFQTYLKKFDAEEQFAFFVLDTHLAHNEGTKFGSRPVLIATPIILHKDIFEGKEGLKKYVVFENRYQMQHVATLMIQGMMQRDDWPKILHNSRVETMKVALFDGELEHFINFLTTSGAKQDVWQPAFSEIQQKYEKLLIQYRLKHPFKTPSKNIFQKLRVLQKESGYQLPEEIK